MKVCPRCKREFEDKEFGTRTQRGKTYLKTYCKQCNKEYQKQYNKKRKYVYRYNKYEGL